MFGLDIRDTVPPGVTGEIGETIGWLASPGARMVTGAVIAHDGGMS
ncbi:hypothetical protein [Nocardioides pyridinolyticus]